MKNRILKISGVLIVSMCLSATWLTSAWTGERTGLESRVPAEELEQVKAIKLPFPLTKDFVAKGKALYEGKAFCSACHGLDGTGRQMNVRSPLHAGPSPTNFGDAAWQAARSNGELFWILKHGSHGTDMTSYLPLFLTEEEAWQIVTYIRSFGKS